MYETITNLIALVCGTGHSVDGQYGVLKGPKSLRGLLYGIGLLPLKRKYIMKHTHNLHTAL